MHQVITVSATPDRAALRLLDQRLLPRAEVYLELHHLDEMVDAIRTLAVRGAPAIGVAAALGLAVVYNTKYGRGGDGGAGLVVSHDGHASGHREFLAHAAAALRAARPTAVNLMWAIDRMLARATHTSDDSVGEALWEEAHDIAREDREACQRIGEFGAPLLSAGSSILTHCNAGALATAGIGTALAPAYIAKQQHVNVHVYACETRPLRQGARLTAWELERAGIPVTVLPDSAAASLIASGAVSLIVVGADRIAANGDVANKVGTYAHAVVAAHHGVPFYVAAPWSTFDPDTPTGADIIIEHRSREELAPLPADVGAFNPAFDVTPRELVTGYITDRGVFSRNDILGVLAR